jgi:hypothetical protein
MSVTPRRGGALDPAALQQFQSKLQPGSVLRLHSGVAGKTKRHVLIFANAERSLAFFINSRPSDLVLSRADWAQRQIVLPLATHSFMSTDSVIACHDTVALGSFAELAAGLAAKRVEYLGAIDKTLYAAIAAAAAHSKLIADRDHRLIAATFA